MQLQWRIQRVRANRTLKPSRLAMLVRGVFAVGVKYKTRDAIFDLRATLLHPSLIYAASTSGRCRMPS
jgi:hypothetical protein